MFTAPKYQLRKKFFKLVGADFDIYNEDGTLAAFCHQQGFKLKEALTCYSDQAKTDALFTIQARNILDFGATYDVTDAKTGEVVGSLRRKGLKSMLQDEWMILNNKEEQIGIVKEDSLALALVRRMLTNLVPQNYDGFIGDQYVADFKQNFNPFVYKLNIDFSKDTQGLLDRRLGLAAAILLAAIEGKQK
ncbi:MAG: hypothetical protein WCJ58_06610 [bacterium]